MMIKCLHKKKNIKTTFPAKKSKLKVYGNMYYDFFKFKFKALRVLFKSFSNKILKTKFCLKYEFVGNIIECVFEERNKNIIFL